MRSADPVGSGAGEAGIRRLAIVLLLVLLPAAPAVAARTAGRVKGTVRDPGGTPLAGVPVKLTVAANGRTLLLVTHTDGEGIYRFEHLAADTYGLEVGGQGFETVRKESILVRPPFRNIIDFSLKRIPPQPARTPTPTEPPGPARTVTGSLRDEGGEGVPDADIRLLGISRAYRGRSDPDGNFLVERVPAGTYRLEVDSPGFLPVLLPAVRVEASRDLEVRLNLVEHPLDYPESLESLLPEERPLPR